MATIKVKRGTRSEINTAASASGLNQGELYLITDEDVLAVGTSTSTYEDVNSTSSLPVVDAADNNVLSESGGVVTLTADVAVLEGSSSGDLVRITQTGSGNALVVEDSANPDSTPFVVTNNGKVGIGTTSPNELLSIVNSSGQVSIFLASGGTNQGYISYFNSSQTLSLGNAAPTGTGVNGGQQLNILSSGNVGIGTSSPNATLEIGGTATPTIRLQENGDGLKRLELSIDNSSVGRIKANQSAGALAFDTVGTERMRIDSSGNLLVGKIVSTTSTEGVELKPDVSTGYAFAATGTSQRVAIFNRLTSDGELISFRKDGTVVGTISTNAYSLPSDRNFKKDISELEFGLDLVKKLKPKTYRYKINDDNSPFMIGLVAQDLEESLLEVGVNQNDCLILQYNENVEDGDSKYQLDYSKLIPILAKAIQEQQTLIESQQSQIDALTARIEALETT